MESFAGLLGGFSVALTPENLLFALIGCTIGMLVGVLPGIGQSGAMALLIPVTYVMPPAGAIIMLASIFYGAAYGGRITSILMNVPGESEAIVTTFDGYPMARSGRAGAALSVSAIASFAGGLVATVGVAFAALPLSRIALQLGPAEYFALMLLGLCLAIALLGDSVVKGLLMLAFGLFLAQIGTDPSQGGARFTFGEPNLLDGIPLLAVIMGFFGVSDVLLSAGRRDSVVGRFDLGRTLPGRSDLHRSAGSMGRGAGIGFFLGLIPGMVAAVSTFASYVAEKRIAKNPELFGKGEIKGVAGPETANNAFATSSFIPLLTFGIPSSAALAILLSAFQIHGVTPGAAMFVQAPDLAWGLIASMFVGNAILLILSLPLVRVWVMVLRVPSDVLGVIVIALSVVGIYSVRSNPFDILLLVVFSVLGAVLKLLKFPLVPAVLAFVLGDRIEGSFRQALILAQNDPTVFLTRPITATLLGLAVVLLVALRLPQRRRRHHDDNAPNPSTTHLR